MIFAPNIIHVIKCSYNPYYRKCDARTLQKETMDALINTGAMHPEFLHYLLENNMLQDGDLSGNYPSKLGDSTVEHDNVIPFYGMVVYQRMTDNELAEIKKTYDYDANIHKNGVSLRLFNYHTCCRSIN